MASSQRSIIGSRTGAQLAGWAKAYAVFRSRASGASAVSGNDVASAGCSQGHKLNCSGVRRLCSTLTRLAGRIGIDRKAKDITRMLQDYLRERATETEKVTTPCCAAPCFSAPRLDWVLVV
jgi:hypothetical protein